MTKIRKKTVFIFAIIGLLVITAFFYLTHKNYYSANDLNISELKSENDEDKDGIHDYTDICLGARAYIETKPVYKSKYYKYYEGGYPTDKYGVCTDVIWHAFSSAGFDIKSLIDNDISENKEAYGIENPDTNIDFRRVKNLNVFFSRNAEPLGTNLKKPEDWQAGDIVVFSKHIAICSDKRNAGGYPFIIHHSNIIEGAVDADDIKNYKIVGHYRWSKKST